MGLLARSLVVLAAFAAGSWVGLHSSSAAAPAPALAAAPPPVAAPSAPVATDTPDPLADAPEINAFPHLNPEASITKAWRLAQGPHRAPGDNRKILTLTFDDGPFPETTPKVLDLLEKYHVRATFFVIGQYLDGHDERAKASRATLQKVAAAGHFIGNHTHDHALLTAVTHTQVLEQIDRGAASIERAIGKKPVLFRPPFGELDTFGQEAAATRGLDILLWNVEAQDMQRDDTLTMVDDVIHQIRRNEGGVVLLHDIRYSSIVVARKVLAWLDAHKYDAARPERAGYAIVDLPTYLREVAAAPPRVRTH